MLIEKFLYIKDQEHSNSFDDQRKKGEREEVIKSKNFKHILLISSYEKKQLA